MISATSSNARTAAPPAPQCRATPSSCGTSPTPTPPTNPRNVITIISILTIVTISAGTGLPCHLSPLLSGTIVPYSAALPPTPQFYNVTTLPKNHSIGLIIISIYLISPSVSPYFLYNFSSVHDSLKFCIGTKTKHSRVTFTEDIP